MFTTRSTTAAGSVVSWYRSTRTGGQQNACQGSQYVWVVQPALSCALCILGFGARPAREGWGRFYSETSEEATATLAEAIGRVWACEVDASGVVVDAERSRTAAAILTEGVHPGCRRHPPTDAVPRIMNFGFWDRVSRQVTRERRARSYSSTSDGHNLFPVAIAIGAGLIAMARTSTAGGARRRGALAVSARHVGENDAGGEDQRQ